MFHGTYYSKLRPEHNCSMVASLSSLFLVVYSWQSSRGHGLYDRHPPYLPTHLALVSIRDGRRTFGDIEQCTHVVPGDAVDGEGERVGDDVAAAVGAPHQHGGHGRHLRRHRHRECAHAVLTIFNQLLYLLCQPPLSFIQSTECIFQVYRYLEPNLIERTCVCTHTCAL